MQKDAFNAYLAGRGLSKVSSVTACSAVRRIERDFHVDIDEEFDRDELVRIAGKLFYTTADHRAGRPNPSPLDLRGRHLRCVLPAYRSYVLAYAQFRKATP